MKKIKYYRLSHVARELGVTRERARQIWDKGRGWDHDAEDLDGKPLFIKCPIMPKSKPAGRPRIGEHPLESKKQKKGRGRS